jgi:hypothetical protein
LFRNRGVDGARRLRRVSHIKVTIFDLWVRRTLLRG